jgi:hypothetical protein
MLLLACQKPDYSSQRDARKQHLHSNASHLRQTEQGLCWGTE